MKKNQTKPIVLIMTGLLWTSFAQAQNSINASGGDAIGSGGTVAYSVGQTFYTTNSGTTGTVEQGVQHAYEIYSLGIEDSKMDISLIIFPNPTTDNLTLKIGDYNNEKLSYQLYDMQGKLLKNDEIKAEQTQIEMKDFARATYFINVVNKNNEKIESFKIIKN
ncbi:MAG: T9SS type A sorting domain-containing protein [Bacteroidia bacterium]|nr:T9SS type A sorting domain-containing protein [Bacteroidia bacterium]